ncbi:hypothetical protein J4377_15620 [Halomonas sp. XH26]|uniref:hypothetical protein n=1 Tax=Halomonas sp. XH26 TaxID=2557993 RepID=UPI00209F8A47|nr:hypothetical protein [Halomonas sp. XH26]UTA79353.1 hypothetical protein J4377_15620 [Halomonas sp. XH26]
MDTYTLTLVVAIGTMWVSLTCGFVAMYLILSDEFRGASQTADRPRKLSMGAKAKAEDIPTLANEEGASWGVQVLFETPSPGLNERLSVALASAGAVYEPSTKSFTVMGESSRNPIVIENAFPPGQLPSFTDDNSQYLIKGVTIKVNESGRSLSPSKLQLARLVSLAKSLARLGGKVVDANQQPITKAGFKAVISGKAKV